MDKISSEGNYIHIITSIKDNIAEGDKIKVHSVDISLSIFSKIIPQRLKKNILKDHAIKTIKSVSRFHGFRKTEINSYLNKYIMRWNQIIDKNNLQVIYLMEPLNVPYNPDIIALEEICNAKGILFKFIRSSFFPYNIEVHDSLHRVKKDRLAICYDDNYWNKIDDSSLELIANRFKQRALDFMNTDNFKNILSKGNDRINKVLYDNVKVEFSFKYILLLLTKSNNSREIYISNKFIDKIKMIEELSNALPSDFKLVVKDHPHNINNKEYTRKMRRLANNINNVVFVNQKFDTLELVSKSELVVSTTSHSAYQSLFQNKKVVIFGDNLFLFGKENSPVFRLGSYDNIKMNLEEIIKSQPPIKYIDRYMYMLETTVKKTAFFSDQNVNDSYCNLILEDFYQIAGK